jgi:hypothetical protein
MSEVVIDGFYVDDPSREVPRPQIAPLKRLQYGLLIWLSAKTFNTEEG